ncbi:ribonuclease Oy [Teleopsis dalmanni]|uniref:ribonuclease Oy n=1 Tax=Teleopsis dalmanni TaxID=139649 RepID=UPI0018CD09CF|nr:ribonuclease Oy [Teleopsis dalmanni]
MLERRNFIYGILGFLLITTQLLSVISSAIPEKIDSSEESETKSKSQFDSDEFFLPEYEDDIDFDLDVKGSKSMESADNEWDVLIFTQQWPVTTCYHWREEDKSHECKLPDNKEFWTIHGIWPTKLGQIGPSFCNKSADFDLDQLEKIEAQLETFWPTIHDDSDADYLWKHEWLKHGTCAALLEKLNNELKYFSQGLNWRDEYLISNILADSGIHPDSNNTVVALQTALIKGLGRNPTIHCIYDNKRDISYLDEIRICFNKSMDLVDCDGVIPGDAVSIDYPGGTVITNCHISKPVNYPSIVPPLERKQAEKWKFPVVNMYKLLQFIMWFTL